MSDATGYRCLLCGGNLSSSLKCVYDTRFGISTFYSIGECPFCAIEQTIPVPTQDELKELYETHYNYQGEHDTLYTRLRERFLFSPLYFLWMTIDGDISFHSRRGTGRLLDVGCNEGRGLKLYRRNGFVAEGAELNVRAAEVARTQGFHVHTVLIEELDMPDSYDVLVCSNVLEHATDPRSMLLAARRLLTTNGEIWISCPNRESWLRKIFGRFWINWHVPFHILHFSTDGITRLLDTSGFDIIELRHETPALWATHSLLAGLSTRQGRQNRWLRKPFVIASLMLVWRVLFFPTLWLGNRLEFGDCLVIRARKRSNENSDSQY